MFYYQKNKFANVFFLTLRQDIFIGFVLIGNTKVEHSGTATLLNRLTMCSMVIKQTGISNFSVGVLCSSSSKNQQIRRFSQASLYYQPPWVFRKYPCKYSLVFLLNWKPNPITCNLQVWKFRMINSFNKKLIMNSFFLLY